MFGRLTVIYLNIQIGFVLNPDYLFLDVPEAIFKYGDYILVITNEQILYWFQKIPNVC